MNSSLESHLDLLCDFSTYIAENCGKELIKYDLNITNDDFNELKSTLEYLCHDEVENWMPLYDIIKFEELPAILSDCFTLGGKENLSGKFILVRREDGNIISLEALDDSFKNCNYVRNKILKSIVRRHVIEVFKKYRESLIDITD